MNAPATPEVVAPPRLPPAAGPIIVGRSDQVVAPESDAPNPAAWAEGSFRELPEVEARLLPGEKIEAQPRQKIFLETAADIAVYGGSAYSGKTYAMLLVDLQFRHIGSFRSVTFRREMTQVRRPGGLWDESTELFAKFGARPLGGPAEHWFPSGARTKFAHIEHEKDIYSWDGAQLPVIKFDQLESFSENMFWYLVTRNRDPSGRVTSFVRATCNPMPDVWLKRLLAWWIDGEQYLADGKTPNPRFGYAIPERSGKLRWMVRIGEGLVWADTREELWEKYRVKELPDDDPKQIRPMSVTFIVATIWDNKIGLAKDPGYVGKLMNAPKHERDRLLGDADLGGNWNARPTAGSYFRRTWCKVVPAEPQDVEWVRGWDFAATEPSASNADPDWTVGVKMGKYRGVKRFVVSRVVRARLGPAGVKKLLKDTAVDDGVKTVVRIPEDPAQAGKAQKVDLVGELAGFEVRAMRETGDKVTRFGPFSSQAEAGNVDLVAGLPEEYIQQLENFCEDAAHKDDADATSSAFHQLAGVVTGEDVLRYFAEIGPAPNIERLKAMVESVTRGEEMPLAPGLLGPVRIVGAPSLPGIASIAADIVAEPSGEFTAGVWRVKTEPHKAFTHGAGRRFTADEKGIIDRDISGTPLREEDALVLIRAGCARTV